MAAAFSLVALLGSGLTALARQETAPHGRALRDCPAAEVMGARCGDARRASLGNCLSCVAKEFPGCGSAAQDDFCRGGGANGGAPPPPPPPPLAGSSFPGSRLLTQPEWGSMLNSWTGMPAGQVWARCFDSHTDDASEPSSFHRQCDPHPVTLTVARNAGCTAGLDCHWGDAATNAGGLVFGGFVRPHPTSPDPTTTTPAPTVPPAASTVLK